MGEEKGKLEENRQKSLKRLRNLRPIDDEFMRCIFKDNKALAQFVLRIFVDKEDLIVESVKTQEDMKRLLGARSVTLDIYATDSKNRKYDIEIQRANKGADKKRARYHSSVIDVENLNAGDAFSTLPESFVIFITENDLFGDNKPFHRVERLDLDAKDVSLWEDGEHILYVNGAYRGDSEIGRLMHDFCCSNSQDMYFKEMQEITRYFKETQKGVESMCKEIEDMLKEERYDIAENLIAKGNNSLEEIAECTKLSLPEVQELARKMRA